MLGTRTTLNFKSARYLVLVPNEKFVGARYLVLVPILVLILRPGIFILSAMRIEENREKELKWPKRSRATSMSDYS